MKSGIYKRRDNGKHIYVRKDRSIGAIELSDVHPCEKKQMDKVSEREGGQVVVFTLANAREVFCDRVADSPRGVSDCCRALGDYLDSLKGPPREATPDEIQMGQVHHTAHNLTDCAGDDTPPPGAAQDENYSGKVYGENFSREGTPVTRRFAPAYVKPREPSRDIDNASCVGNYHEGGERLRHIVDPELDAYHGGEDFVGAKDEVEAFFQRNPVFAEAYDQAQPRRTVTMDIEAGPPGTIYFSGGVLGEVGVFGRGTEEVRPADEAPLRVGQQMSVTFEIKVSDEVKAQLLALRDNPPDYQVMFKPDDAATYTKLSDKAQLHVDGDFVRVTEDGKEIATMRVRSAPEDIYKKFADAVYNGQARAERQLAMPRVLEAPYGMGKSGNALWWAMSKCADGKVVQPLNIVAAPENEEEARALVEKYRKDYPRMRDVAVEFFGSNDSTAGATNLLRFPAEDVSADGLRGDEVAVRLQKAHKAIGNMLADVKRDLLTDRLEHVYQDEYRVCSQEEQEERARARLAAGEFRLCHAASARKHKKKRDRRVWWHPVFQQYAWAKVTA